MFLFKSVCVRNINRLYCLLNKKNVIVIARPKESQLKLEVEFHRVPYNQTFDFVTGQFHTRLNTRGGGGRGVTPYILNGTDVALE